MTLPNSRVLAAAKDRRCEAKYSGIHEMFPQGCASCGFGYLGKIPTAGSRGHSAQGFCNHNHGNRVLTVPKWSTHLRQVFRGAGAKWISRSQVRPRPELNEGR